MHLDKKTHHYDLVEPPKPDCLIRSLASNPSEGETWRCYLENVHRNNFWIPVHTLRTQVLYMMTPSDQLSFHKYYNKKKNFSTSISLINVVREWLHNRIAQATIQMKWTDFIFLHLSTRTTLDEGNKPIGFISYLCHMYSCNFTLKVYLNR